jgi:hypothetical protein
MSSLASEIRFWLARYLGGAVSLDEFHRWLMSNTWNDDDPEAAKLAHRIQLRLAEFLGGAWTEEELRDRLWSVHGLPSVTLYSGTSNVSYSTSDPTALAETQVQLSDIEPAKEYV